MGRVIKRRLPKVCRNLLRCIVEKYEFAGSCNHSRLWRKDFCGHVSYQDEALRPIKVQQVLVVAAGLSGSRAASWRACFPEERA